MSLIEKEVEVGLNGNNIEYYKNLGYEIPMKKATKNTWYKYHKEYVVDKSKKIRVKIEHLQNGSRVKVSLKCDECGKITKSTYVDYLSHNHNGKTYCNKCSSKVLCSGEKAYNYRYDLTKEERENSRYRNLNPEYSKMVKAVLKRDNYTCQCCHKRIDEKGVVHHIEGYASNKELQCSQQNCVTLCFYCHERYHRIYGKTNVNRRDFEEFLGKSIGELKEYNGVLPSAKEVYCIEEDKIYKSAEYLSNEWNCDIRSIYNMCNHNPKRIVKSVKGKHLLWYDEYKNMSQEEVKEYLKWCNNKNKPKIIRKDIYCLTTNKKFTSFTEAGDYYNINRKYISECCNNKRGYCENNIDGIKYKFMYYTDYIEKQKLQEQN